MQKIDVWSSSTKFCFTLFRTPLTASQNCRELPGVWVAAMTDQSVIKWRVRYGLPYLCKMQVWCKTQHLGLRCIFPAVFLEPPFCLLPGKFCFSIPVAFIIDFVTVDYSKPGCRAPFSVSLVLGTVFDCRIFHWFRGSPSDNFLSDCALGTLQHPSSALVCWMIGPFVLQLLTEPFVNST